VSDPTALARDLWSLGLTALLFLGLALSLSLFPKGEKHRVATSAKIPVETEWAAPRKKLLSARTPTHAPQRAIQTKQSSMAPPQYLAPPFPEEPSSNQVEEQTDLPSFPLQLVYAPEIKLPASLEDLLNSDETALEFELTLGPSSKNLRLVRSSGQPEVDLFCHQFIEKKWMFKPAIWRGEPIESKKRIRIQIRPD
jgi:hypothetical protein